MKQQWKVIVPLMLSGSLMACSTTSQIPVEPELKPKVEQPKPETEQQTKPAEKPVEKPAIVLKAKKTSDGKLILGEKEWVYVPGLNENFRARVDTGATTSSISAVDVVNFERDGKDWVKFRIEHDNVKSDEISLPVERWVNIRQSSAEGTQQRAVVVAWIEIGDLKERTEFTLADRTHLTFPLLLGRSFFKDVAVVDVSRKYVQDKHK
ncbi:ATP-dependent zinc protease family protein [Vibrio aestuarianus]|uniref:ATP-dependent zinc protease family protein n=1 Tax=Vibrio aestuarianus TaxID=28171 RepID=UPI00237CFE47|nr:ATP-dependent zinc protease [Vibrio aestuarianus]MDE1328428.1 ATP-dependent zinc protease [Vibrio aestuarianus]